MPQCAVDGAQKYSISKEIKVFQPKDIGARQGSREPRRFLRFRSSSILLQKAWLYFTFFAPYLIDQHNCILALVFYIQLPYLFFPKGSSSSNGSSPNSVQCFQSQTTYQPILSLPTKDQNRTALSLDSLGVLNKLRCVQL